MYQNHSTAQEFKSIIGSKIFVLSPNFDGKIEEINCTGVRVSFDPDGNGIFIGHGDKNSTVWTPDDRCYRTDQDAKDAHNKRLEDLKI